MSAYASWKPWSGGGTSQGKTFLRCASRWWFESVAGHKLEASKAMELGSALHAAWERYLLTGELAEVGEVFITQHNDDPPVTLDPLTELNVETFLAPLHRLPAPPVGDWLVEHNFTDLETYAPVRVRSTIDLYSPDEHTLADGRRALLIVDHKSTSSLKWAKAGPEIRSDFQGAVFVVQAQRATGWTGPIVFRLLYSTTRRPIVSEVREHTFEPADVDDARTFVRETLHAMLLTSTLQHPGAVPYNVTACDDYKSRANPDGCPHRARCAGLGRKTAAGFDALLYMDFSGVTPMSVDPLADLLATQQTPVTDPLDAMLAAAQPPAVDPAHALNLARFAVLRPQTTVGADQLLKALEVAEAEQTRLVIEITTLDPSLANDEARAMLRQRPISRLIVQRDAAQPKHPATMERPAIEAEIVGLMPEAAGHFEGKPIGGLIALLLSKRAERATANHAINSPENIATMAPVDTKAAAIATQPVPAAPPKKSRGLRLPEAFGGGLVGSETKKAGNLQRYLVAQGIAVPTGAGSTKVMKELVKDVLMGTPAPAVQAVAAISATTATVVDAQSGILEQCRQEIAGLALALGVTTPGLEGWDKPKIVTELGRLRVMRAEVLAATEPPATTVQPIVVCDACGQAACAGAKGHPCAANAAANAAKVAQADQQMTAGIASPQAIAAPFVLFIDCHPTNVPAADLNKVTAGIQAAVAEAAGVGHYLAIDFANGSKKVAALLAAQVANGAMKLPAHVYVSSASPTGPSLIEALAPLASEVVRGDR